MDKKVISREFNVDTACVEVRYTDGSMISIDCSLVKAEAALNMYESSGLEWLVYNAPVDHVNLLLHGEISRNTLAQSTPTQILPPVSFSRLRVHSEPTCFELFQAAFTAVPIDGCFRL